MFSDDMKSLSFIVTKLRKIPCAETGTGVKLTISINELFFVEREFNFL